MATVTETEKVPRLARTGVDWARLYREGLRVRARPGAGPEVSGFVAPFTADHDLVVLLIPCTRGLTGAGRTLLVEAADAARHAGGLWTWLQKLGRRS
jgi:hypothetical protein